VTVTRLRPTDQTERYQGVAADTKPTDSTILAGSEWFETDTGTSYRYDGAAWVKSASVNASGQSQVTLSTALASTIDSVFSGAGGATFKCISQVAITAALITAPIDIAQFTADGTLITYVTRMRVSSLNQVTAGTLDFLPVHRVSADTGAATATANPVASDFGAGAATSNALLSLWTNASKPTVVDASPKQVEQHKLLTIGTVPERGHLRLHRRWTVERAPYDRDFGFLGSGLEYDRYSPGVHTLRDGRVLFEGDLRMARSAATGRVAATRSASWSIPAVTHALLATQSGISFDSNGNTLDVYQPATGSGYPCVIYVHGGGWTSLDSTEVAATHVRIAAKGFTVFSLNYRLAPGAARADAGRRRENGHSVGDRARGDLRRRRLSGWCVGHERGRASRVDGRDSGSPRRGCPPGGSVRSRAV